MSTLGPYELDSIITGDALDLLSHLPDGCVNIVLTSPPYNIGLKYDGFNDNLPEDEFREFTKSWLTQAFRVMADAGRIYVIVHEKMLFWIQPIALDIGFNYGGLLTWCKPNSVSRFQRMSGDWMQMAEPILEFRKGARTPMVHGEGNTFNWFVIATPQTNFNEGRQHPAQLPLELCRRIISRTPGDVVLDPFCGSGSVLIAARGLNRHWLGCDLVEEVAQKARDRMAGIRDPRQMVMFADGAREGPGR